MYYHIKLVNKNDDELYFYDKDIDSAKRIKEQFYYDSNIVCEGHIVLKNEKKNCIIIQTPYTIEMEVKKLANKYPRLIITTTKESIFNEYKNIIDEI